MIATWQAPLADGSRIEELVLSFDRGRQDRLLVLPALFDEANKLRRFTVETLRHLDAGGVDTFLPDLPGMNESLAPLDQQTLTSWRMAAASAAETFAATHVLALRAAALLSPPDLCAWFLAPQTGAKALRAMIRARTIASREAGVTQRSDDLYQLGRLHGITLAGWSLNAQMFRELESAEFNAATGQTIIAQADIGGAGLWLRAEPSHDPAGAKALAARLCANL